jgi:hypothetical protein
LLHVQLLPLLVPQLGVAFCDKEYGEMEDLPRDAYHLEDITESQFGMSTMKLVNSTSGEHIE